MDAEERKRKDVRAAREMAAATVDRLGWRILEVCRDWIAGGPGPDLDEDEVRRRTHRLVPGLVAAFEALFPLQGRTFSEACRQLGWPDGRAEALLAEPSDLGNEEALCLCGELGLPMHRLLELLEILASSAETET